MPVDNSSSFNLSAKLALAAMLLSIVLFWFAGLFYTLLGSLSISIPLVTLIVGFLGLMLYKGDKKNRKWQIVKWESSVGIVIGMVYTVLFFIH
ncbi:MAG TPA: hypothetical protein VHQ46_05645 [Desulfobacteria bacterium]|nr:hypothetical protein [Desulfobacteria bacterium]